MRPHHRHFNKLIGKGSGFQVRPIDLRQLNRFKRAESTRVDDIEGLLVVEEKSPARQQLFGAFAGNRMVGFAEMQSDHLDAIYVSPSLRGSGIGALLLSHSGARTVWVRPSNAAAQAFYRREGFQPIPKKSGELLLTYQRMT